MQMDEEKLVPLPPLRKSTGPSRCSPASGKMLATVRGVARLLHWGSFWGQWVPTSPYGPLCTDNLFCTERRRGRGGRVVTYRPKNYTCFKVSEWHLFYGFTPYCYFFFFFFFFFLLYQSYLIESPTAFWTIVSEKLISLRFTSEWSERAPGNIHIFIRQKWNWCYATFMKILW